MAEEELEVEAKSLDEAETVSIGDPYRLWEATQNSVEQETVENEVEGTKEDGVKSWEEHV